MWGVKSGPMTSLSFDHDENLRKVEDLASRIRAGQKVVFLVGSAASLAPPACMPSAGDLKFGVLKPLADKLPPELRSMILADERTLVEAWRQLPSEVLFQQMTGQLGERALQPLQVFMTEPGEERFNFNHVVLAAVASRFSLPILTTNWDLLVEHAGLNLGLVVDPIIFGENQLERMARGQGEVRIVKLHGSADMPPSLVTTVDQAGEEFSDEHHEVIEEHVEGAIVCLVGYSANDYNVYHAIQASPMVELWVLLGAPQEPRDPSKFERDHKRLFALLEEKPGTPVVCDIVRFLDVLFSKTVPTLYQDYRRLRQLAEEKPSLDWCKSAWQQWGLNIRPIDAYRVAGDVYHFLGDGEHSTLFYSAAIESQLAEDQRDRVLLFARRCYGHGRTGRYWRGVGDALKALWIAVRMRNRLMIAEALYCYANAIWLAMEGISLHALVAFKVAELLYRRVEEPSRGHGRASSLQHIYLYAELLPARGPLKRLIRKARDGLEWSYGMFHGPNGNAVRLIARMYRKLGDLGTAFEKAQEAMEICAWYDDRAGVANCHRELGWIWLSRQECGMSETTKEAKLHFQEALRLAQEMGDCTAEVRARLGLGQVLLVEGDRDKSLTMYNDAWKVIAGFGYLQIPLRLLVRALIEMWKGRPLHKEVPEL